MLFAGLWPAQTPVQAVFGGDRVDGTPYVLTMLTSEESRQSFCSMALLSERVVVTAAHCVVAEQSQTRELRFPIDDIFVSQPGADVTRDDAARRVKVLRIVTHPDYVNVWRPEIGDTRTQVHDIAFLFLAEPLSPGFTMPVATQDEIDAVIAAGGRVTQYGYGLQTMDLQSHTPWKTSMPALAAFPSHLGPREQFLMAQEGPSALCPGDSGGPWYITVDGVLKIAAVSVAAGGCRSAPPYSSTALGTRIARYLPLLEQEWERFLSDEEGLQAAERRRKTSLESARADGTFASPGGCHGRLEVELQLMTGDGGWRKLTGVRGWLPSGPGCPSTHPWVPWTVVDAPDGSSLRWRYQSGEWVGVSDPFIWKRMPASSTPTTMPTPVVTPTPTPTPTATAAAVKKTTIICVKAKVTKKVTAIKPRCPQGFRKR